MSLIDPLPKLMVAPNGARRTKKDHANLPIEISEIVETAKACQKAGADGIHVHVRDKDSAHSLDAGLYREVLDELKIATPDLYTQITTEAVGQYSSNEQRELVFDLKPKAVSVSIAEMLSDGDKDRAAHFYQWCYDEGVAVQHILYGQDDLRMLEDMARQNHINADQLQVLFVLGRYALNQESSPEDLTSFTSWLSSSDLDAEWAVCAFGRGETDCLVAAHRLGGKLRVGFENSLQNHDGSIAKNNAERVSEIVQLTK